MAIPRLGDYRGPYGFVSVHEHSRRRLGTALRHNQVVWCFLFIAGTAPPSRSSTPRRRCWSSAPAPGAERGVALGTALSLFSMGAGLGLGTLVARLAGPWVAWPLAPLVASIGFLLLAGIQMGIAGYSHDAGGVGGDFDA